MDSSIIHSTTQNFKKETKTVQISGNKIIFFWC